MEMLIQEIWLARFKAAVEMEIRDAGGKDADGYRAMATKTGLTYAYIYQIYKGKPTGKPKMPGSDAMNTIERLYGSRLGDGAVTQTPDRQTHTIATPQSPDLMLEAMNRMSIQINEMQKRLDQEKPLQIDHAWPFKGVTRDQWISLTDAQREYIESGIKMMLGAPAVSGSDDGTTKQHAA